MFMSEAFNSGQKQSYDLEQLTVVLPGMLYDVSDPPIKSILLNLTSQIDKGEVFLQRPSCSREEDGVYYQTSIEEQVDGMMKELVHLNFQRRIERVNIISHSVGAITAASLVEQIFETDIPLGHVLLLSPPPIYPRGKGMMEIKESTSQLIGYPEIVVHKGVSTEYYTGDSGKVFAVTQRVWEDLSMKDDVYGRVVRELAAMINVIAGSHDRVFPIDLVQESYKDSRCLVLDDTHSLKKQSSVRVVVDTFRKLLKG
jgi:hypothetical protein